MLEPMASGLALGIFLSGAASAWAYANDPEARTGKAMAFALPLSFISALGALYCAVRFIHWAWNTGLPFMDH